ncbi:unnamed protein product [Adineta ricciae]|uniref:Uncharacterized protein n=1 Tax=Adineta ricciae TaxID=249248 RepID=A0A813X4Z2_ADIRI|nr:unnamed protein product [Adineta ricciae]
MPIASGFTQDPNPNYQVRKQGRNEFFDETIYYKDASYEKPIQPTVKRPIIKETVFMPDRKAPPIASNRDIYTVSPELDKSVYTTTNEQATSSFNLIRALGLNADCPCWAWICIIFSILLLLGLLAMCLYFILGMFICKS